jgi:type IV pilus assembly protein PilB
VPRETTEKYCLVPIFVRRVRKQGDTLYVAMDDPTNEGAIEEVMRASQLPVKPMIACASDIRAAIRVYYGGEDPAAPPPAPPSTPEQIPAPPVSAAVVPIAPAAAAPPPPPSVLRAPPPPPPSAAPRPPVSLSAAAPQPPVAPPPSSVGPDSTRAGEIVAPAEAAGPVRRGRPRMISLTLLDGTTISLPASGKKRPSRPDVEELTRSDEKVSDQLTARDLVSALRAVSHGVDATEILGTEPRWEALFSALLSILLRKGLIADWEFIEEFRKI